MDLTKEFPRSPNESMAGIVSLARMLDKTHAAAENRLGDYDVDCPHDRPVLEFMGINYATFAEKARELNYDDGTVEKWSQKLISKHSKSEIDRFNASRRAWGPDGHSQAYFDKMAADVAPGRDDVKTWFALLDLDEHRSA